MKIALRVSTSKYVLEPVESAVDYYYSPGIFTYNA